jgi:hypothetical protein
MHREYKISHIHIILQMIFHYTTFLESSRYNAIFEVTYEGLYKYELTVLTNDVCNSL